MSISGLRKASWYNPDDGTVVQANDIAEDGEFYTRAIEDPDDQTPTGESPYAGDESYCELMIFDMSLLPQLKAWQESDTHISMVAAGVQQNIQWYERDLIAVKPVYPVAAGRRNHINVVMERTGHGAHDIHGNVNLLAYLGTTSDPWTDTDGNEIPDGYKNSYLQAPDFAPNNNEFRAFGRVDSSSIEALVLQLIFPVRGIDLTFSSGVERLHDDGETRIAVVQKEFGGGNIRTINVKIASVGRKSITTGLVSKAFRIKYQPLRFEAVTAQNKSGKIGPPSIRVDESDKYVSY